MQIAGGRMATADPCATPDASRRRSWPPSTASDASTTMPVAPMVSREHRAQSRRRVSARDARALPMAIPASTVASIIVKA